MQGQMDFGKALRNSATTRGSARACVCGGNGELAFIAIGVLRCEMLDVRIQQQTLNDCHQLAARDPWAGEAFVFAIEKL